MSNSRENDKDIIPFSSEVMDDTILYPKPGKNKSPYNKFGDVMICQSRKLSPNITISSLFECIISDINVLLQEIKG